MVRNVAELTRHTFDGGVEMLIKDYIFMMDKKRFSPILIVRRRNRDSVNDKILVENGAKIISIYKSNFLLLKIIQKLNDWWYTPYRLKKILTQENIEILHIHHTMLKYVKKISNYLKKEKIKLIYTCHSEPILFLGKSNYYENIAAKHLIKNNNLQMIALHNDMRNEVNDMFGINSTVIIRNGIDFVRFKNVAEGKNQIRKAFNIPKDSFIVGHIGRFEEEKNHMFLTDVFAELCRRKENAFLLMIGAGSLEEQIINKLNRLGLNEKYLILSHRADVPRLLKAMDVFVFPSIYEGFGIVLIEAQISGLRCVISDTIPKEALQTKLAVPVSLEKSPSEWCDIILDDSIMGTSCGNIDDYDMNKEIKRLESLYLEQIN